VRTPPGTNICVYSISGYRSTHWTSLLIVGILLCLALSARQLILSLAVKGLKSRASELDGRAKQGKETIQTTWNISELNYGVDTDNYLRTDDRANGAIQKSVDYSKYSKRGGQAIEPGKLS
jgi:hypothetical protein